MRNLKKSVNSQKINQKKPKTFEVRTTDVENCLIKIELEEAAKRLTLLQERSNGQIQTESNDTIDRQTSSNVTEIADIRVPAQHVATGQSILPPLDGKVPRGEYMALLETAAMVHESS